MEDRLRSLLSDLPTGLTEIMVHPAKVDADHQRLVAISDVSAAEYQALTSFRYLDLIRELGGIPATYRGPIQ